METSTMTAPTKFEVNPLSGLPEMQQTIQIIRGQGTAYIQQSNTLS